MGLGENYLSLMPKQYRIICILTLSSVTQSFFKEIHHFFFFLPNNNSDYALSINVHSI